MVILSRYENISICIHIMITMTDGDAVSGYRLVMRGVLLGFRCSSVWMRQFYSLEVEAQAKTLIVDPYIQELTFR